VCVSVCVHTALHEHLSFNLEDFGYFIIIYQIICTGFMYFSCMYIFYNEKNFHSYKIVSTKLDTLIRPCSVMCSGSSFLEYLRDMV
jgi:hypothetical protein